MFSNWIPGIPKQNFNQKNTSVPTHVVDQGALMKEILNKIQQKINEEMGEDVHGEITNFMTSINQENKLESVLIETKQKYHDLVNKLETQSVALKEMLALVIDFMENLGQSLGSEDLNTPIKDFESGFLNFNVSKVEKQLKYFSKLYEAALADYLKIRINSKSEECKDEVSLYKNLNKSIETEIVRLKNEKSELEKKVNDFSSKNAELTDKILVIEKLGSENLMKMESKDRERAKEREEQLLEKIKISQKEKRKLQKSIKQSQVEIERLNSAIQVVKNNQELVLEEMQKEISNKQSSYSIQMTKSSQERISLEQKLKYSEKEAESLKNEIVKLKNQNKMLQRDSKKQDGKEQMEENNKDLINDIENLRKQIDQMVSKEIMSTLFLSYEDESKEWTIRRGIKNQIYGLLGIKHKPAQNMVEEKKWFGLF